MDRAMQMHCQTGGSNNHCIVAKDVCNSCQRSFCRHQGIARQTTCKRAEHTLSLPCTPWHAERRHPLGWPGEVVCNSTSVMISRWEREAWLCEFCSVLATGIQPQWNPVRPGLHVLKKKKPTQYNDTQIVIHVHDIATYDSTRCKGGKDWVKDFNPKNWYSFQSAVCWLLAGCPMEKCIWHFPVQFPKGGYLNYRDTHCADLAPRTSVFAVM